MAEFIRLIIAVSSVVAIGWVILSLIGGSKRVISLAERLSLAYGIGLGCVSLEMFSFYFLKIPFHIGTLLTPWVLLFIGMVVTSSFLPAKPQKQQPKLPLCPVRHRSLRVFLTGAIIFEVLYAFFRGLIKPLEAYDAVAIYGIKAKIFYLARSIPREYFTALRSLVPHPDYPLHIPLAEAFFSVALGTFHDQLFKVIFPLYFAGILVLMYYGIRRFAHRTYALLFTFLTATVPQLNAYAANGYVDIVLAFYWFAGFLFLFLWFQNNDDSSLWISAIMIGLAGWSKNEGLLYCVIAVVLAVFWGIVNRARCGGKETASLFLYALIIAAITLPWLLLKRSLNIANEDTSFAALNPFGLMRQMHKIPTVLYEFQKEFFGPKKWNIIWPIIGAAVVFRFRAAFSGQAKYIGIAVCLAVLGYVAVYLCSPLEIGFLVSKTWSRFLLHFLPVALFWAAYTQRGSLLP